MDGKKIIANIYLRLLFMTLLFGCIFAGVNKSLDWNVISVHGVKDDMGPELISVTNDSCMIIAESNIIGLPVPELKFAQSWLYKSCDGGTNWLPVLKEVGRFHNIVSTGSDIWCGLGKKLKTTNSLFQDSLLIYHSSNGGVSWEIAGKFADFYNRNILLQKNGIPLLIGNDYSDDGWKIMRLTDTALVWREIGALSLSLMAGPVISDDLIASVIQRPVYALDLFNIETNRRSTCALPDEKFHSWCMTATEEGIYIGGVQDGIKVLRYDIKTGKIDTFDHLNKPNLFPKSMKIVGDKMIMLLISEFGYMTQNVIYTKDLKSGSWKLEESPVIYFDAFDFSEMTLFGIFQNRLFVKKYIF